MGDVGPGPRWPVSPGTAATAHDRLAWLGILLVATALLVTARLLSPSPSGVGTHLQLGLPPCGFLALTSLPCPACGLTTAFSQLARCELLAALHANAVAVPLFLGTLLAWPFSVWAAVGNVPFSQMCARLRLDRVSMVFAAVWLVHWLARIVWVVCH